MTPEALRQLLEPYGPGAQLRARYRGDRVELKILWAKGTRETRLVRQTTDLRPITAEHFEETTNG